ncbi:hypothetical protein ACQ4PT_002572 [Festuca glaucescens]
MAELLRRRVAGEPFPYSFIHEADPYSAAPEDLVHGREHAPDTDPEDGKGVAWYFCWSAKFHGSAGGGSTSKRKRKVAAAGATYWHPETGKQAIIGTDRKSVGAYKRTLSYMHKIKNSPGVETPVKKKRLGWCMVEIGLDHAHQQLVLCKLYKPHPPRTHPEISKESRLPSGGMPCPAPAPAPLGAEIPSTVAIVRNGSAAAAVTVVIDLCGSSIPPAQQMKDMAYLIRDLQSPVVVCSAMGNTTTTILLAAWKAMRCGTEKVCQIHELVSIKKLHLRTTDELGLETSTVSVSHSHVQTFASQSMNVAMECGISVRVRNPYKSQTPGTLITKTRDISEALSKFQHFDYLGISVESKVTIEGKMSLTLVPSELSSQELIKLALGVLRSINAAVHKFSQDSSKVMKTIFVVGNCRAKDCVEALHSAFFEKGLVSEVDRVDNVSSSSGVNRDTEAPLCGGQEWTHESDDSVEEFIQNVLVSHNDDPEHIECDNLWDLDDLVEGAAGGSGLGIALEEIEPIGLESTDTRYTTLEEMEPMLSSDNDQMPVGGWGLGYCSEGLQGTGCLLSVSGFSLGGNARRWFGSDRPHLLVLLCRRTRFASFSVSGSSFGATARPWTKVPQKCFEQSLERNMPLLL